jgi:uncharacterized protein (DUF1330 family)
MAAYMVAVCDITNFTEDMGKYVATSAELVAKNGGEYIVRGPAKEQLEGDKLKGSYVIVTRFPTLEQLKAFHDGDEYQAVKPLRDGTGSYHIAVYEAA